MRLHPLRFSPIRSAAALALLASAGLAHATADDLFVKLDGVTGDVSTPQQRAGWIAGSGLSWRVQAEASYLKGAGAAVGKATPSAITWSQGFDSSMNSLYKSIASGTNYTTVTLEQSRDTGVAAAATLLSIKGTTNFVTDVSMDMGGISASIVSKQIGLTVNTGAWGVPNRKVTADWNIATAQLDVSGSYSAIAPTSMGSRHAAATDSTVHAYMRLETRTGDSLAGFSTAYGYENWIELGSAGWGLAADTSVVKGTGAAVGKAAPTAFSWTQGIDATLPLNLASIVKGAALGKVVIEYVRTQADGAPVTFMQQVLRDAFFTDISLSDSTVSESVVFKSFDQTLWAVNSSTGQRGASSGFSYSVAANTFTAGAAITRTSAANFGQGQLDGLWANAGFAQAAGASGQITPGPVSGVPEPQSWALMLAGGALLGALARRRAIDRG